MRHAAVDAARGQTILEMSYTIHYPLLVTLPGWFPARAEVRGQLANPAGPQMGSVKEMNYTIIRCRLSLVRSPKHSSRSSTYLKHYKQKEREPSPSTKIFGVYYSSCFYGVEAT